MPTSEEAAAKAAERAAMAERARMSQEQAEARQRARVEQQEADRAAERARGRNDG